MKSGLLYTGLLLVFIISCIGFVNAAPKGDTYLTVNIGQNDVDVTKYVIGDEIGWCPNSCAGADGPTLTVGVPDKSAFDITPSDFFYATGFWYNLDSGRLTSDIALNVVDSYKTVRIGQNNVDVTQYVFGDQIGWWASAADVYQTAPSKVLGVTDKSAFDITSSNFVGYDGFWYNLNSEGRAEDLALNVVDPQDQSCGIVYPGDTIDVSKCVSGSSIGWWANPDYLGSTAPSYSAGIKNRRAFYVDPTIFGGYGGNWYNINPKTGYAGTLAFTLNTILPP